MREQLIEVAGDCPFTATCADKAYKPVDDSGEPIPEPRQESDVHDKPDDPCDPAGEPHPAHADDRASAAHGCHAAEVPVSPRSRLGPVSDAGPDNMSSVETGLKRNLGDPGQVVAVHHVADHEYLRVAW